MEDLKLSEYNEIKALESLLDSSPCSKSCFYEGDIPKLECDICPFQGALDSIRNKIFEIGGVDLGGK